MKIKNILISIQKQKLFLIDCDFKESKFYNSIFKFMAIKKLIVHHSGSPISSTAVDDISNWHKERGFSQIGYHKIIEKIRIIQNEHIVFFYYFAFFLHVLFLKLNTKMLQQ